jgi:hypothetical protein
MIKMGKYIVLGIMSTTLAGVILAFGSLLHGGYMCLDESIDKIGLIDRQLDIKIEHYEKQIDRNFVATKSSDKYELFIIFEYPKGFDSEKAKKLDLFVRLGEQVSNTSFSILDQHGKDVELHRIQNPSPLSNPENIIFLLAANLHLKKSQNYSINIKFPPGFNEAMFLNPVIYIARKPCPTL